MSDRAKSLGSPRRSSSSSCSSSDGKRREKDFPGSDAKRRKPSKEGDSTLSKTACPPPLPTAGPSEINEPTASQPVTADWGRLTSLLSGLIEKLDKPAATPGLSGSCDGFSGFHDMSLSEDEDGEVSECPPLPDPLDELDTLTAPVVQPPSDPASDLAFQRALDEFAGHFQGEEKTGEPLSERLASIFNASLRRRPSSDCVKLTCDKIRLPSNVPNLKVPVTNSAITKAMSVGGKLVDTRLALTNGLLTKALVPIAHCLSDIGEKKIQPVTSYLDGLNNSLRLLTSAVNYINQLRKEVARIHVNDSALEELCKWECEVGKDDLFPFDVVKKCEDIHKSRKLGRPSFRPHKTPGRRFVSPRHSSRRSLRPSYPQYHHQQSRPRPQSRLFLGQRPPQGKGMPMQKTPL